MIDLRLLVVFLMMLVAACQFEGSEASNVAPQTMEDCQAVAGKWIKSPLSDISEQAIEYCLLATTDAGSICQSSEQCQSICVAGTSVKKGQEANGQCFKWAEPVGHCLIVIENGIAQHEVCFD